MHFDSSSTAITIISADKLKNQFLVFFGIFCRNVVPVVLPQLIVLEMNTGRLNHFLGHQRIFPSMNDQSLNNTLITSALILAISMSALAMASLTSK